MKQEELWKDIKGHEGTYQVSSEGRVRSLDRVIKGRSMPGKLLKLQESNNGYLRAFLCVGNRKNKPFSVHRLVAKSFIDNSFNKPVVNHIDGDKQNNSISNLEWSTLSENTKHSFNIGLQTMCRGEKNPGAKTMEVQVLRVRELGKYGVPVREIATLTGVSVSNIYPILKGRTWTHI